MIEYKRMVDDVRRRTQQAVLGHRGHKDDPLYRTRRLMTRGWERLSDRQREKLFCALAEGDPTGEVAAAMNRPGNSGDSAAWNYIIEVQRG